MKSISMIFLGIATVTMVCIMLIQDLDAPVVYNSNSRTLKSGKTICVFVDTKYGKQQCSAYSESSRAKMTQRWAK